MISQPNPYFAEFSKDMLQTLIEFFDVFADEEHVIRVEINIMGIWLEEPQTKTKKFVGKARPSEEERERMRIASENRKKH